MLSVDFLAITLQSEFYNIIVSCMKSFLRFLFCVVLSASLFLSAQAETAKCADKEKAGKLVRKSDNKIRPRSVETCIYCYCYNGELSFDSYDDINNFTVSVTDESNGQTAMFYLPDMSETVSISLSAGIYKIELRTFDGQEFEGVLTISE